MLAPASIDEVATTVAELQETSTPFAVGSTADGAVADGAVLLSVSRLSAVEIREASLTLRAEAGATVSAARSLAERAKLALVGVPERAEAQHVGGLVARGEVPRRAIAGIEAVLPTGERVRTGGSVLKDVVAYDLAALLLGSMGRLAVIVAVTFRLEPIGAHTPVAAPAGVTQTGDSLLVKAFDPRGLLRARQG